MFSVGTNVRNAGDQLRKVNADYLYNALSHPKPEFESRIMQLRVVRRLNEAQYRQLKCQLPFFVCGTFNPPYRKTENFAYTECFVIDIDHVGAKGLVMADLKARIAADPFTFMCFVSPGEDGLKVVFRLSERCYDAGVYSAFYKRFASDYSVRMGLEQVVDSVTCDVSRACFMSVDKDAYYNPDAEPVEIARYVSLEAPFFRPEEKREKREIKPPVLEAKEDDAANAEDVAGDPDKEMLKDPDSDTMDKIREMLDMRKAKVTRPPKDVFVPEVLNRIEEELRGDVQKLGFDVSEICNIQYGKKIRAGVGLRKAEVNLFYGKRGFSVVVSPKTGTDEDLNNLLADAVRTFISAMLTR